MRRFFLALISVILLTYPVMAQARLGDFTIRGNASQEMRDEGFVAAHPSLPLNSTVRITNPRNSREIEVTIVGRINPSVNRIIDLSPSALQALGLRAGEQVVITVNAPPRPALQTSPSLGGAIVELNEPVVIIKATEEQTIGKEQTVIESPPSAVVQAVVESTPTQPAAESSTSTISTIAEGQAPVESVPRAPDSPPDSPVETAAQRVATGQENREPASQAVVVADERRQDARDDRAFQSPINITVNNHIDSTGRVTDPAAVPTPAAPVATAVPVTPAASVAPAATSAAPAVVPAPAAAPAASVATPAGTMTNTEFLAWLMSMTMDARESREAREAREAREVREAREARESREIRSMGVYGATQQPQPLSAISSLPTADTVPSVATAQPAASVQPAAIQPAVDTPSVTATQPAATQPVASTPSVVATQPAATVQPATSTPSAVTQPAVTPADNPPVATTQPVANQVQDTIRVVSSPIVPPPVQADAIQIVPGLPDRNSGKIYRLQVGAYSAPEVARRAAELMRSAGFDVELEQSGSIYRVMAVGIASVDVYQASVRLGSLGFGQVWVRE